jgi:FKBP-type peptidyl-prolyl cis-trans isomerase
MTPMRILVLACAVFAAPVLLHAQREKLSPDDLDIVEKRWPDAKKSNTGIRYVIESRGKGRLLVPGDMVMVNYVGSLLDGTVFDRQLDKLHPLTFRVGRGDVIDGWDQILQLMRPGDKWTVIIPPELGYGRRGNPPRVPGYSTLVFVMEVVGVKKDG